MLTTQWLIINNLPQYFMIDQQQKPCNWHQHSTHNICDRVNTLYGAPSAHTTAIIKVNSSYFLECN